MARVKCKQVKKFKLVNAFRTSWLVGLLFFSQMTSALDIAETQPKETQQPSLSIAFILINNLHTGEGQQLPYDKFWYLAKQQMSLNYKAIMYPPARAFNRFGRGAVDCVFPSSTPHIEDLGKVIYSKPINYSAVYLVSHIDGPHFTDLMNDQLHRVAVQRGYFTSDIVKFKTPRQRMEVNSIEQQIGMLMRKRVDAILVYQPDLSLTITEPQLQQIWYDSFNPLVVEEEQLVCWDNPRTRQFISDFDQWLESVDLDAILGAAKVNIRPKNN